MDVETQQQHAAIRETVRRFAQDQLLPNALRWDREREFPRQALQELGAMGLFGVTIPEKWGGAELDNTALAIAIEEIAAGDCSTSLIVAVNNIISKILDGFGSQSQKELFLKELASGKINGAFALTEPQAGSDASSISTRAERQGSHYVLNGAKQFITTGKNADIAVVFAVTNKDAGKRGISAFVVPTSTPGYIVARVEDKSGHHASDTAHIVLRIETPSICWAKRGKDIALPWRISSPGASTSPRRQPVSPVSRSMPLSHMRPNEKPWASPSSNIRP